jgi:CHASE2 domain-containing sensor protein
MNTTTAFLLWGVLFSSIGFGFFLYGKKEKNIVVFVCGVGLMAYPYFVSNTYILFLLGVVITVIPYFLRD